MALRSLGDDKTTQLPVPRSWSVKISPKRCAHSSRRGSGFATYRSVWMRGWLGKLGGNDGETCVAAVMIGMRGDAITGRSACSARNPALMIYAHVFAYVAGAGALAGEFLLSVEPLASSATVCCAHRTNASFTTYLFTDCPRIRRASPRVMRCIHLPGHRYLRT